MRRKKERIVSFKIDPAKPAPLTPKEKRELAAVAKMSDADIDYSDIPPLSAALLQRAVRGGLYRPVKRQMTVRLDADILAWLKSQGKRHHSRLNQILRAAMLDDLGNHA